LLVSVKFFELAEPIRFCTNLCFCCNFFSLNTNQIALRAWEHFYCGFTTENETRFWNVHDVIVWKVIAWHLRVGARREICRDVCWRRRRAVVLSCCH